MFHATIFCETHFDAAHYLKGHPTCGRTHGHTYRVRVELTGKVDEETDMVADLAELKEITWQVIRKFDHQHLNYIFEGDDELSVYHPTCEVLAWYIAKEVYEAFTPSSLITAEVSEGVGQGARVMYPSTETDWT